MSAPQFSVIIPVFNKWSLTRNCLESLKKHTGEHDFEVIVVDNHSTDETVSELLSLGQALFPDRFTAIVFLENRNFGPACNSGAKAARSPLLFFLNNDTILTTGWAAPLLEALSKNKPPGAVGPLLLYKDDTVQHVGVARSTRGVLHLYKNFPRDHPAVLKPRKVQFLTGAAIMIPAKVFWKSGGFYEAYQNGYEDLELSIQIRQLGYTLLCVPSSVVYHLESQTPGRSIFEKHNLELFQSRCEKKSYIDVHHHAVRDGFEVFIDDYFHINFRLTPSEEKRITAAAKKMPLALWPQLNAKHPLWVFGKEYLATHYANLGQYTNCIYWLMKLADIDPRLERFQAMQTMAEHAAPDATWPLLLNSEIKKILLYRENLPLTKRSISMRKKRFKGDDRFVEELYAAKLRELTLHSA